MAWVFLFFLLAWPVMEFVAFAKVADWVGTPLAILGLFLSAFLGMAVLRGQSFSTARKVQAQMNKGQMPVRELFDSAALALAGILLIVPGYVTDIFALLLLLPPVRNLLYGEATFLLKTAMKPPPGGGGSGGGEEMSADVTIIEADYKVVSSDEKGPSRPRSPHDDPPSYGSGGSGAGGGSKPSIRLLL